MIDIAIKHIINDAGLLEFKFPRYGNGFVTGGDYAAQKFAKIALTNPGTDKRFPALGGGMPSLLQDVVPGRTYESDVKAAIIIALSNTKEQIKDAQTLLNIPRKDALVDYDIIGVSVDRSTGSAACSVRIRTFDEAEDLELNL